MKTLRYNVFAIGGYIVRNGNQKILKLALAMKRRESFDRTLDEHKLNQDATNF